MIGPQPSLEMDYRMSARLSLIFSCATAGMAVFCSASPLMAQLGTQDRPTLVLSDAALPDAPAPQQTQNIPATSDRPAVPNQNSEQTTGAKQSGTATTPESSSSVPQATDSQDHPKTRQQIAEEQLEQEKKQRVFGFLPSFNTSYIDSAVSLTAKQKIKLAFTSATDPVQFGIAGFAALLSQAEGSDAGYGGGIGGYGKRFGADYADSFDGALIGNGFLPALLHQDPRYFRRGYGSTKRRIFYAISTSFICKHDVTGKWEPNYSNVVGNLAAGGISNLYVPQDERGVGNVFEGAALVTIEGGAGAILQEFWPDISRHFFHKDPTHGRDAATRTLHQ
jgi:hypothetical protein